MKLRIFERIEMLYSKGVLTLAVAVYFAFLALYEYFLIETDLVKTLIKCLIVVVATILGYCAGYFLMLVIVRSPFMHDRGNDRFGKGVFALFLFMSVVLLINYLVYGFTVGTFIGPVGCLGVLRARKGEKDKKEVQEEEQMEFKYPKLKKGLSLVYISIWINIFGNMLRWAFNYAGAILGQSLGIDWIAGIIGALGEVLFLVGVFTASRDRKKYMTVFLFAIGSQVASFWHGFVSAFNVYQLTNSVGMVSKIITFIYICLLCMETAKFLKEEGAGDIAKLSIPVYIGYGLRYGVDVVMMFLAMFINTAGLLSIIASLVLLLGTVVGGTMYIVFFHQSSNFVEELKVEMTEGEIIPYDDAVNEN